MRKFFGGCMIVIQLIIQWAFYIAILAAIFWGLIALSEQGDTEATIAVIGIPLVILFLIWRIILRPIWRRGRKVTVPATIIRVEKPNNITQPELFWTRVIFESRGKRIQIRLTPWQVNDGFADKYHVGDTGVLTYAGDRMYNWKPPTPEAPIVDARHRTVFISYAHEWAEDAEYLAQYFQQAGLNVWFDKTQIRTGDRLTDKIKEAIQRSTFFMPLLSPEYWTSEWCIQEFELAANAGAKIMPVKVSAGELVMPPHIRRLYREQLGEPVFLDMRGRNPVAKLRDLAQQMVS